MRILNSSVVKSKITNTRVQIYFLASTTFIIQLSTFQGEDIVNARLNYLTGAKTDFWGGASTLVYAHIPSLGFKWQIWLAAAQICCTASGLILLFKDRMIDRRTRILDILAIYTSLVFGSQMTRDGLLFSLLVLGFGLIQLRSKPSKSRLLIGSSLSIIFLAMSIRPWMALAIGPLVVYFLIKHKIAKRNVAILLISVAVMPLILDAGATRILRLKESYPQQQVMVMDLAATHCYSNNEESVVRSKIGLSLLTRDQAYFSQICEIYRPDTWESLTMAGHGASKGLVTDFWLIPAGDLNRYEQLRNSWFATIVSDPVTYIQNKILFIGKLAVGSDSRTMSILSAGKFQEYIVAAYKLPFEVAVTLHLFSIILSLFWIILIPCRNYLKDKQDQFILESISIPIILSLLLWAGLSAVAYIGSNGRYTYSITLLGLVLLLSQVKKIE